MFQIHGWSHVLLEHGVPVGVARNVEDIEDYGPFGTVYFFGSHEPPEYTWLNKVEMLSLGDADTLIVDEVSYELARMGTLV
jgi:hypothetical protein